MNLPLAAGQTSWGDPLTILTGVIALATITYVACTIALWRSTQKAAKAATVSAEASRGSTELLAALNRPYMGVDRVVLVRGPQAQRDPVWEVSWEIRNFGTLPALGVEASVRFLIETTEICVSSGPRSAEIFPQSAPAVTVTKLIFQDQRRREEILSGNVTLIARVHIAYAASDGQQYKHHADARFDRGLGTFSVIGSETIALSGRDSA